MQRQLGSTGTSQLPTWLDLLVTPRSRFERVEEMRRARLFLVILLAGITVSLVIFGTGLLLVGPLYGFIMTAAGFGIGYLIGRFVSFALCKIYTITLMTSSSYLILLFIPAWYNLSITFISAITVMLMALLLVRIQAVLAIVIVNLMALLVLPVVDQQATDLISYLTMMAGMSVISLMVMVVGYLTQSDVERAQQGVMAQQAMSEQLRGLLDSSPDLMAVHANGKFLYINASGMRLLGAQQPDQIVGQEVRAFMPENNRSVVAAPPRLTADNALTVSYQQSFQRMDRRLIDTEVTVSPIQFESELATLLVARDRRPSAETPSQNEFPLDRLLDRLPVPVVVTQGKTLIYANHYIEALTGYTPAEIKRLTWASLVTDVDTRSLEDSFAGKIQETEIQVKHKNGQTRTLIMRTQMQEYRGHRLAISIGYDPRHYTRWKEQDMWMLETAFTNYPEGLVYLDTDLRNGPSIISANRVFSHTSGYSLEELRGRTLNFLLGTHNETSAADVIRQSLEQGEAFRGTVVYQRKDTTSARVNWSVSPIRDDRGQMLFVILRQRPPEPEPVSQPLPPGLVPLVEDKTLLLNLMTECGFVGDMTANNQIHLLWANEALCDLRHWSQQDLPSVLTWDDLVLPTDSASLAAFTYETLRTGTPRTVEVRLRTTIVGETHWVSLTVHPIPNAETPETLRLYGVAHDISERVQAEEAIKVHLVQQSVVMELGLLAIAADDFKSLVEQVVLLCEQVVPDGICVAALYYPGAKELEVVGHGTSTIVPAAIPFDIRGVIGYTAETSLPLLIDDYTTDERFHEPRWLPSGMVRSALSVAIPGHLKVHGVLTLFHASPRRFIEDDIYFIQSIANVLAAFAERERMQGIENEQRDFLKVIAEVTSLVNTRTALSDLLRITQEFIAQVVTTPHSSTISLIDENQMVRVASQRGYDHLSTTVLAQPYPIDKLPLAQSMALNHQPLLVNNMRTSKEWYMAYIPEMESYLGAPILVEGTCIGIINLGSSQENAFSAEHAERLMLFAGKIGSAIRNARYAQNLEIKIAERTAELGRQRSQLQAILEASGEGIFHTENRRIVFANQELARLTGYDVEDIWEKEATMFYPEDLSDQEKQTIASMIITIDSGKIWRHPMRVRRKDGSTFHAGMTISRIQDGGDGIQRSVIIMRDIEAERRLEEQKNRFITNAAHELRSPISNLSTRMYLVRRSPQNMEDHLRVIERVIERINRLVNDLLDLSYFEHGHVLIHKQPLILQDMLLKAIEFVQAEADQKDVTIQCDMPAQPLTLLVDPHRLEQVFVNIMTFCLMYTDKGRSIQLAAIEEHTMDHVLIVVEDNGRGLPPEHVEHLFEPFYRLEVRQPGSGLGLTLAREIILLHKGTLEVNSTLEAGTRFIIRLPLDGMESDA